MAIYSLHHQPIGKSTQARPYTASAHIHYITRTKALTHLDGERLPVSRRGAMGFLRQAEDGDRKNARVVDKVMLALPREFDAGQRHALVREFAEAATQGRAGWLAAYHDGGKDADNPHCHLVIRDRDPETGKRVAGLSEKGSTERLRLMWEQHVNAALERAGRSERVDRRTLEAQGLSREPTIHEGPRSREMDRRGARP
ncbi:MobA/MobL family protein, partial [Rhodoplanes elegans]